MRARFSASTGAICGSSTMRKRGQAPRPSRSAASCSSTGTRCRPANCRIMLKAHPRQLLAAMTEAMARAEVERKGSGPRPTSDSQ